MQSGRLKHIRIWFVMSMLVFLACNAGAMTVFVKLPGGTTLSLDVEASDSVENVKARIQDSQGILQEDQRLFYLDNELEDSLALSDYNIGKESTLTLVPRVRIQIKMDSSVMAMGGGTSSSSSYALTDTVGQGGAGNSSSTSYRIEDGFLSEIAVPATAGDPLPVNLTNGPIWISVSALLLATENPEGDPISLFSVDASSLLGGSLVISNGWVIYTPPVGFTNIDTFNFLVRDANGNVSSAVMSVVKVTLPPSMDSIGSQYADVLIPLTFTNHATDTLLPLTWTLNSGAPTNAYLNPTNGVFVFRPTKQQARSTNLISVIVSNSGIPAGRATNTFELIVGDYSEITLGRAIVLGGMTNSIPMVLKGSAPLTNLQVSLNVMEKQVVPLELISTNSSLSGVEATLTHSASNVWSFEFSSLNGQPLPTNQTLAHVNFLATAARSAFVPVDVLEIASTQKDGSSVSRSFSENGRLTVIVQEPLLEMLPPTGDQLAIQLYGLPNRNYQIQASPSLNGDPWLSIQNGVVSSDGLLPLLNITNVGPFRFFRALELQTPP